MSKIIRLSYGLVLILFLSLCSLVLHAQEGAVQEKQEDTAKPEPVHHTQTVTGCLQKGDEPGEFSITGEDGKTWGLESSSVKLEEHIGHRSGRNRVHQSGIEGARKEGRAGGESQQQRGVCRFAS